ncbi:ead/Ea22-like family protein [Escherichia coli]|uniref:ead/Ea22-like family protein n=1 Tax=Escherichia coli TaxID=562 RepID=UPI00216A9086|nr:ead/Ea22-like family protein [Escherichia coli]
MRNIDKQALREIAAAAVGAHERLSVMPPDDIFDISLAEGTQLDADITALNALNSAANPATVLALLDELEAKDSTIATQQQEIRTLLNALGQASEKRNAEQADIIAKQEKWIKDVEETMISATDRAEAAEKRIAELERKEQHSERQSVIDALAGSGEEWSDIEEYMQKWDAERASAAGKGE